MPFKIKQSRLFCITAKKEQWRRVIKSAVMTMYGRLFAMFKYENKAISVQVCETKEHLLK